MAWEEITFDPQTETTCEEVVAWFSPPNSLKYRLCNLYHPRLKGKWACGELGNPISSWINTVSALRHKVVHGGYRPTGQETTAALETLAEMETYVEKLIGQLSNVQKYTFSVYMMLGPVGLTRQSTFTKNIQEKIEGEPMDWRQSFYDFRRWVIEQLS